MICAFLILDSKAPVRLFSGFLDCGRDGAGVTTLNPAVQTRLAEKLLEPYFDERVSWEVLRILPGRIEITGFQARKGTNALRFSRLFHSSLLRAFRFTKERFPDL